MTIISEKKQLNNQEIHSWNRDEMIVGLSINNKTYACKAIVYDDIERKLEVENKIKTIFKNHKPEQLKAKLNEIIWKESEEIKWEASNLGLFTLFLNSSTIKDYKDALLRAKSFALKEGRLPGDTSPRKKVGKTIKYVAETEHGLKANFTNFAQQLVEGDYAYSIIIDLDKDFLVYRDNKEDKENIIERKDLI